MNDACCACFETTGETSRTATLLPRGQDALLACGAVVGARGLVDPGRPRAGPRMAMGGGDAIPSPRHTAEPEGKGGNWGNDLVGIEGGKTLRTHHHGINNRWRRILLWAIAFPGSLTGLGGHTSPSGGGETQS